MIKGHDALQTSFYDNPVYKLMIKQDLKQDKSSLHIPFIGKLKILHTKNISVSSETGDLLMTM